jgi:GT2 family glycosyltransferase
MQIYTKVSIIIPTKDRAGELRQALLSLNNLRYYQDALEIIVVDDGSQDDTKNAVEQMMPKFNFKLVYYFQDHLGISAAKNKGIELSFGDIIVTTDDDCLFEPDWLKKLISPFESSKIGAAGGPDKSFMNNNFLAKAIDFAFSSFLGSGGIHGRYFKNICLGKFYPMGCNMAIPRKVLDEVGLFDVSLAPGEETDLSHRIEAVGYVLKLIPEAFVWHKGRNTLTGFFRQAFTRGCARVEIIRRHMKFAEFIYFFPALAVFLGCILIILGIFFKLPLLIFMILSGFYSTLLVFSGILALATHKQIKYFFTVPLLILLGHVLHGLGFLLGISSLIQKKNFYAKRR